MISVTATEFTRKFGEIQHTVHREAVEVKSHGRTTGYFVSPEDFAEYKSLKEKARKHFHVGNLPKEKIQALRETSMDERHAHLNALLDD